MRVLLLGGTSEARALAARLHPDVDIISSLAGRVPDPALPVGPVRIGGFGGIEGMGKWLHDNVIGAVVDATHPFAATITANAFTVCEQSGVPYVVLSRPAWEPDGCIRVKSDRQAAKVVEQQSYSRVFLTSGRSSVSAFTGSAAWLLIRVVTPPDPETLPRNHELLLSRGPYGYADDRKILVDNQIDVLVTKNSGGALTKSKLDAARDLDIDIVMIDRPPVPAGANVVQTVERAQDWVRALHRCGQPG